MWVRFHDEHSDEQTPDDEGSYADERGAAGANLGAGGGPSMVAMMIERACCEAT